MIYAYGNVKKSTYGYRYNDSDRLLSDKMLKYWSNFVKAGNPNSNDVDNWPKLENQNKVFELGTNVGIISDKYTALYNILDEYNGITS